MAGVEIDSFQSTGCAVCTHCSHEAEAFADAVYSARVLRFDFLVFDVA